MYINKKGATRKNIPLREQLNAEIKIIARKRLSKKDLDPTARKILEDIVIGKSLRNEAV